MSTSWDLYCLDCEEPANVMSSHSPIRREELWPMLTHAAAIGGLVPLLDGDDIYEWRLANGFQHATTVPIRWLAKHAAHRLRLRNEYGEIDGQCGKEVRCVRCKQVFYGRCKLDIGHAGECEPSRHT